MNERAIGYQLRCKDCKENDRPGGYCFVATNHIFWDKWEHWKIPRNIPYFLKRAAVTHELFDLIVELRPSSTSAGLAENLKREFFIYLNTSKECSNTSPKSISLDNTFKSAGKATIIDKDGYRQNPLKGGILSAINEEGEGLSWVGQVNYSMYRFCVSPSPAETRELLQGIAKRHDAMGIPKPLAVIVDNCCQVRRYVREGLGDETAIVLDVYHFIMRYGAAIYGGTKNAHRREVLLDIRNAIIKNPAKPNQPATYWEQSEQETRITEAYDKWVQCGGVWSAAAPKVRSLSIYYSTAVVQTNLIL
ncbi:hypothetical protein BDZ97DRAFT_1667389 [Flammula alnicola]|nr:hypothetical protein BDZ97DRAFT_1667389 [Flammula alnicola]